MEDQPESFDFSGIWAWPVNLAALTYGVLAIINMVWPRSPLDPWYRNYGMIVMTVIVVATGLLYAALLRPYEQGDAAAGDAHRIDIDLHLAGCRKTPVSYQGIALAIPQVWYRPGTYFSKQTGEIV